MDSIFLITIVIICISTLLVAIIQRNKLDVCLKEFNNCNVKIILEDRELEGDLTVTSTGCAISQNGENNVLSHIVYKNEYVFIQKIVRNSKLLNPKLDKKRSKKLTRLIKRSNYQHNSRLLLNILKIIKDSFNDIFNLFISQMTKKYSFFSQIGNNSKYVNQMNQEYLNSINTAFNVILERYIGNKVVVHDSANNEIARGILKDYTTEFLLLFDVEQENNASHFDMIIPRTLGVIRHLSA